MTNDVTALPAGASERLGELYNAAALATDPGWTDAEKITLAWRASGSLGCLASAMGAAFGMATGIEHSRNIAAEFVQ